MAGGQLAAIRYVSYRPGSKQRGTATLSQRVGHQIPRYQLSTEELEAVKFL
jgi:hypothetical protein